MPGRDLWITRAEEPADEHLGQVHLHHPDLRRFTGDCDAYGQPVFTRGQSDDLMATVDGDRILMRHHTGVTGSSRSRS